MDGSVRERTEVGATRAEERLRRRLKPRRMKRQTTKLKPRTAVMMRSVDPKDIEEEEAGGGGKLFGSTASGRGSTITNGGGGGGRRPSMADAEAQVEALGIKYRYRRCVCFCFGNFRDHFAVYVLKHLLLSLKKEKF